MQFDRTQSTWLPGREIEAANRGGIVVEELDLLRQLRGKNLSVWIGSQTKKKCEQKYAKCGKVKFKVENSKHRHGGKRRCSSADFHGISGTFDRCCSDFKNPPDSKKNACLFAQYLPRFCADCRLSQNTKNTGSLICTCSIFMAREL